MQRVHNGHFARRTRRPSCTSRDFRISHDQRLFRQRSDPCPDHGRGRPRLPQLQRRLLRDDPDAYEVVAFTATQIPDIAGRRVYPSGAGRRGCIPAGIPIRAEGELEQI